MNNRPDLDRELELYSMGHRNIAGLDEAGRGALAGPVVAAAVVLPMDRFNLARVLSDVRDSKQLSPSARLRCDRQIREIAVGFGIGEASASEVDELGLLPATHEAMRRAIHALGITPSHLLVDHLQLSEVEQAQDAITRGDQSVLSIASASILAKVWRDQLMQGMGERYTGYGFERNKGYGTAEHRDALQNIGPCPEHRRSCAPVQQALSAA